MQTRLQRGGRRALDLQARCPALAFFQSRLGVEPLELPKRGVRPQQQGIWAHQVAEALFERLPSRAAILATDVMSRTDLVSSLVEATLGAAVGRAHGAYQAALKVEQGLLLARMLKLLELEARRPEFTVVAREASRQLTIGPLDITLRLDRIDALDSGQLAVLDYKTGVIPQASHWLEPPLHEVQLPLYVLAVGDQVGAAAFVQIQTQQPRFRGTWPKGAFPGQPRPAREWAALRGLWEQELHRLADDFVAGQGWRGLGTKPLEGHWAPLSRIYADE
jgi:ATP-dependent helicase/nuclease subunit B